MNHQSFIPHHCNSQSSSIGGGRNDSWHIFCDEMGPEKVNYVETAIRKHCKSDKVGSMVQLPDPINKYTFKIKKKNSSGMNVIPRWKMCFDIKCPINRKLAWLSGKWILLDVLQLFELHISPSKRSETTLTALKLQCNRSEVHLRMMRTWGHPSIHPFYHSSCLFLLFACVFQVSGK